MKEGSITFELEALIDKHGLTHVLTALECICGEKAEHIRINWQDNKLAAKWSAAERRFGKLAHWAAETGPA